MLLAWQPGVKPCTASSQEMCIGINVCLMLLPLLMNINNVDDHQQGYVDDWLYWVLSTSALALSMLAHVVHVITFAF